MLTQLRRFLGRIFERYRLVVHLLVLLVASYMALAWVLRMGWNGENLRFGRTQAVDRGRRPMHRLLHVPQYAHFDEVNGWRLLATLGDESGPGLAVVSHAGLRLFVKPGESLGSEFKVRAVERGTLTIESGGSVHTLALVGEHPSLAPVRGVRIDVSRRTAGELFPLLQWSSVPLGGRFIGMRLRTSLASANAAAFGLRDGDTLESINGLPVTGDDGHERLTERFRNEDAVNLGVRRDGRVVNVFVALYE